jgi:formylglycine-generating enzyme required for sulfatase activity
MNCLSWYEAFAFCAWDGGRIQTELEWQYAASGGGQSRLFPWGNVPPGENFAVYGCLASGSSACEAGDVVPVGSRPDGRGRFGHHDLSGSVFEWALDWSAPLPDAFGDNYAKVNAGEQRVLKGGGWLDSRLEFLETTNRTVRLPPGSRTSNTGVRCAHDPEAQVR